MQDNTNYYLENDINQEGVADIDISSYRRPEGAPRGFVFDKGKRSNYGAPSYDSNVGLYIDKDSKYDDRLSDISSVIAGEKTMDNLRGQALTGFEKIGSGILKGAVLAGTTFIDSVLGLPVGLVNVMVGGKDGVSQFSDLWDNPLTNYLQKANEWSEKVLPNYYSKEELEKKWYLNVFSANFIGDKVLKNVGFFVGAAVGGKVNAGMLSKATGIGKAREAFRAAVFEGSGLDKATASQIYNNAVKGKYTFKSGALLDDLAQSAKQVSNQSNLLKMAGALSAGMGEARIQTVGNINQARTEFQDQLKQELDMYSEEARKNMPAEYKTLVQDADGNMTIGLTPEGEQLLKELIEEKRLKGIEGIEKTLAKVGNVDFLINTALLSASDWIQFGRYYAGGYKNARKAAAVATKGAEGYVKKKVGARNVLKMLKRPFVEGNEEMIQEVSGVASRNMYEQDSWLKAAQNPNAIQLTNGFIKSLAKGMVDVYGDVDLWENFAIGAIIGFGAIPTFKTTASGKKTIGFSGGIWDNLAEIRDDARKRETLTNSMNRIMEDERSSNYMRNLVINNKYEDDKTVSLAKNDEFEYKNADISQLISNVITFDQAGRLEDLKAMNEGFANISSPEDVEDIRSKTVDKETGTSIYDGMSDEQIIESVKKQAEKVNRVIDSYALISADLQQITGKSLNSEELQELTWQALKIDDWEHRFKLIWGEVQEDFKELEPILRDKTIEVEGKEVPVMEAVMASPAEMLLYSPAYIAGSMATQESSTETVKQEIDTLEALKKKTKSKNKLEAINKTLEELKSSYDVMQADAAKSAQLLNKVSDLGRILTARHSFLENYRTYLTEPETLTKHVEDVKKEGEKELEKFNKKELNKKNLEVKELLKSILTLGEFKKILESHVEEGLGDMENTINQVAIADELSKQDHPIAMLYMDIRNTHHSLLDVLNNDMATLENKDGVLEYSPKLMEHARRVLELLVEAVPDAAILKDGNSLLLTNMQSPFDVETYTNEMSADEMLIAKGIVKRAIESVYKTNARHENLALPLTPAPAASLTVDNPPPKKETNKKDALIDESTKDEIFLSNLEDTRTLDSSREDLIPFEELDKGVKHSYWKPAVSEHNTTIMENEKRVVPLKDDANFAPLKPILEVLSEKDEKTGESAFSYVNKGKLKPGAIVNFKIDPKVSKKEGMSGNPLLIYDGDQLIGVMPESNAKLHKGMKEALDFIRKEYEEFSSKPENADKVFTSVLSTQVSRVLPGRMVFDSTERDLGELFKGQEVPQFSLIKLGLFQTPNVEDDHLDAGLRDMSRAVEGRLYLRIPAGDGRYYPAAVRVKQFSKEEFDIDDVNVLGYPVYKAIKKAIEQIVEGIETNNSDLKIQGLNALESNLYFKSNIYAEHTVLDNGATGINFNHKEGSGENVKELFHLFIPTGNAGSTNTLMSWNAEGKLVKADKPATKIDRAEVVDNLLKQLHSKGLRFQVTASQLNTSSYNEELVNSGKVTTNMVHPGVASAWFQMFPLDSEGRIDAPSLPKTTKKEEKTNPQANNPVNAKESVAPNTTKVTFRGKTYEVGEEGKVIGDVPLIFREIISDLAWIKLNLGKNGVQFVGDFYRLEKSPTDIKYINRKTLEYAGITEAAKIEKEYKGTKEDKKESPTVDVDMAKKVAMGAGLAVNPNFKPKTEAPSNTSPTDSILSYQYMLRNYESYMNKKGFTEEVWNQLSQEDKEILKKCASI